MSGSIKDSVILFTMRSLKCNGSWCGETHVQKTIFICQELVGLQPLFRYVLYKHGPFSFDLSDDLQGLISDELVNVVSRAPYGPSLEIVPQAEILFKRIDPFASKQIEFISMELGGKNVLVLEKLATAVFINKKYGRTTDVVQKAEILNSIKSHVTLDKARDAFSCISLLEEKIATRFSV